MLTGPRRSSGGSGGARSALPLQTFRSVALKSNSVTADASETTRSVGSAPGSAPAAAPGAERCRPAAALPPVPHTSDFRVWLSHSDGLEQGGRLGEDRESRSPFGCEQTANAAPSPASRPRPEHPHPHPRSYLSPVPVQRPRLRRRLNVQVGAGACAAAGGAGPLGRRGGNRSVCRSSAPLPPGPGTRGSASSRDFKSLPLPALFPPPPFFPFLLSAEELAAA